MCVCEAVCGSISVWSAVYGTGIDTNTYCTFSELILIVATANIQGNTVCNLFKQYTVYMYIHGSISPAICTRTGLR